jgi:hypothetical protein
MSKLGGRNVGALLVDLGEELMIALGLSDRVGLTLCDSSGKMTQINKITSSGRYALVTQREQERW